jgi:hypothetical protein
MSVWDGTGGARGGWRRFGGGRQKGVYSYSLDRTHLCNRMFPNGTPVTPVFAYHSAYVALVMSLSAVVFVLFTAAACWYSQVPLDNYSIFVYRVPYNNRVYTDIFPANTGDKRTNSTELRPWQDSKSLIYSRMSQHFMEPEGSLPCSQQPATGPCTAPE